jgi:hypothetical protein
VRCLPKLTAAPAGLQPRLLHTSCALSLKACSRACSMPQEGVLELGPVAAGWKTSELGQGTSCCCCCTSGGGPRKARAGRVCCCGAGACLLRA